MSVKSIQCYVCGGLVPDVDTPVSDRDYIPQSPGCWKLYTEVLAREYGEWKYPPIHRLTVDCYAAQHPTLVPNAKSAQSVTVHLAGIYLALEKKMELQKITPLIGRIVEAYKGHFVWSEPPADLGRVTIADVYKANTIEEHEMVVWKWAESVWSAWESKQDEIRGIVGEVCDL